MQDEHWTLVLHPCWRSGNGEAAPSSPQLDVVGRHANDESYEEALAQPLVTRKTLRKFAGRAAWAMGFIPLIRVFVSALWAVSAEVDSAGSQASGHVDPLVFS